MHGYIKQSIVLVLFSFYIGYTPHGPPNEGISLHIVTETSRQHALDEIVAIWFQFDVDTRRHLHRTVVSATIPEHITGIIHVDVLEGSTSSMKEALMDFAVLLACCDIGVSDRIAFQGRMVAAFGYTGVDNVLLSRIHQSFAKAVRPYVSGAFKSRHGRRDRRSRYHQSVYTDPLAMAAHHHEPWYVGTTMAHWYHYM